MLRLMSLAGRILAQSLHESSAHKFAERPESSVARFRVRFFRDCFVFD